MAQRDVYASASTFSPTPPPMWVSVLQFAAWDRREGRRRADGGPGEPSAARVEGCRRGDKRALEEVLGAQAPRLERLLARLVGPGADAEDLLQETFIEAIASFPRFRGDASVSTWLHRIAVNVAHHHLRRPHRRRTVSLEAVPGSERPDPATSPARSAEVRQQLERLYAHLDELAPRKRIAFLLHVVDDHPIAEVAALMGATEAATKSRVFWARRALLARVARDGDLRLGATVQKEE